MQSRALNPCISIASASGERREQMHIAIDLSLNCEPRNPGLGHRALRLSEFDVGVQASLEAMLGDRQYFLTLALFALCQLEELIGALQLEISAHHRTDDRESRRRRIERGGAGLPTRLTQQP